MDRSAHQNGPLGAPEWTARPDDDQTLSVASAQTSLDGVLLDLFFIHTTPATASAIAMIFFIVIPPIYVGSGRTRT